MSKTSGATLSNKSEFPLHPVEIVSVLTAVGLVSTHLVMFAAVLELWHWSTVAVVLLGLVVADFVSGVLHWAGDTWGDEDTPWIGRWFVRPFRFHHSHPLDMLKSNFFTTNGDTALASLPFLLIPFALPLETTTVRLVAVLLASVGAWGMWTSQFHRWAHMKSPPRVAAWLQRRGLILRPEHHRRHHKVPFIANYCITTGWCNPVLTAIGFFPAMEWLLSRYAGLRPRNGSDS